MKNPIVIVEKDRSLRLLYQTILKELKLQNHLLFFENANEALNFLGKTIEIPFLVICNYDLPGMKGIVFKQKIVNSPILNQLSLPFILIGDKPSKEIINKAHTLGVEGFFDRNTSYENLKFNFRTIIESCLENPFKDSWVSPATALPMYQYK